MKGNRFGLSLERFAQSRGYSSEWVDAEMEKRR